MVFAAVFVYALVVNYQSFLDPLVVVLALPGAGSGIILMLFVTCVQRDHGGGGRFNELHSARHLRAARLWR
jgi:hypothetical protein